MTDQSVYLVGCSASNFAGSAHIAQRAQYGEDKDENEGRPPPQPSAGGDDAVVQLSASGDDPVVCPGQLLRQDLPLEVEAADLLIDVLAGEGETIILARLHQRLAIHRLQTAVFLVFRRVRIGRKGIVRDQATALRAD